MDDMPGRNAELRRAGGSYFRWIRRLALAAAIGLLGAQPAEVAAQADCPWMGCNSKWVDKSDELPGMSSNTTALVVGAVVVVTAVVAWRLLRSDSSGEAESANEPDPTARGFSVAPVEIDKPDLATAVSWGQHPTVSCRESPRACLYRPQLTAIALPN
jgi:hypothetical protein